MLINDQGPERDEYQGEGYGGGGGGYSAGLPGVVILELENQ